MQEMGRIPCKQAPFIRRTDYRVGVGVQAITGRLGMNGRSRAGSPSRTWGAATGPVCPVNRQGPHRLFRSYKIHVHLLGTHR